MRFIQHKAEARWFYRVVSMGYDRWINPLFWTAPMRDERWPWRASTTPASRSSTSAPAPALPPRRSCAKWRPIA